MAHMDIFNSDAFTLGSMTDTVTRMPFTPGLLGSLNLFEQKPVRTEFLTIEEKDKTLSIIQSSKRGDPLDTGRTFKRRLRRFDTIRIARNDRVNASEISAIRAYGSETELMQVQDMIAEKMTSLRTDMELTKEMHRLGAIQGKILDADGSVIFDYFAEFNGVNGGTGVAPSDVSFALNTAATDVEALIRQLVLRPIMKASAGSWIPNVTSVVALCGDSFYDKLTNHPKIQNSYLNWQAAADTRGAFGVSNATQAGAFAAFYYGGVYWVNYRSSDNFDGVTPGIQSLGIAPTKAKFFPYKAPGVFQVGLSPLESIDEVNTPGKEIYALMMPDLKRNFYVDLELYSYPLFICTRPEMLINGVI